MTNRLTTYATVIAIGLTFTASVQSVQAREHHSLPPALHHLNGDQPDGWSAAPTRNWYGPGEYDRIMNGSDASMPGAD